MSKNVIINGTTYSGVSEVMLPISGGNALFKDEDEITTPSGSKTITANGTHDVAAYASAVVNVPTDADPSLQEKTATPRGTIQVITPDAGYDGLSSVNISPAILQEKTATPGDSEQEITPDSAYYGLSKVTVGAIPDTYVQPTVINPGGELTAGSTIAAGTYFSGAATVPSGGLENGQIAVDWPYTNGKILTGQTNLTADTEEGGSISITLNGEVTGYFMFSLVSNVVGTTTLYSAGNGFLTTEEHSLSSYCNLVRNTGYTSTGYASAISMTTENGLTTVTITAGSNFGWKAGSYRMIAVSANDGGIF